MLHIKRKLQIIFAVTALLSVSKPTVNSAFANDKPKDNETKQTRQNQNGEDSAEPPTKVEENTGKPLSKSEIQKIRQAWVKRFQGAVKKLNTASADEVNRMEALIQETNDPAALGPMVEVLGRESAPIRLLLDRTLADSEEAFAWVLLAERCLIEPDPELRRSQVRLLQKREENPNYEVFLQHVKRAVGSKNSVRAGLGAMLAADLNWRERVPELVNQLAPVQIVGRITWVPEQVSQRSSGLAYGSVNGYAIVPVPVVGPGVVAYGQQIVPVGSGLTMGGGVNQMPPQYKPVFQAGPQPNPNPAVYSSLVRLTGVDFGYDVNSWKKWIATSFRVEEQTGKRVPTP